MESKLELVIEGHAVLRSEIQALDRKTDERFDLVEFKIETLNQKIDGVAADLSAHRADTESHHGVYRVKE
jgi:cytochrome c556